MVEDGNGDGVRAADITRQIDRVIEAPIRLSDLFPGTAVGGGPVLRRPAASGRTGRSR